MKLGVAGTASNSVACDYTGRQAGCADDPMQAVLAGPKEALLLCIMGLLTFITGVVMAGSHIDDIVTSVNNLGVMVASGVQGWAQ